MPKVRAEINIPVIQVMIMAVWRGRRLNNLSLALPILVPTRSPNTATIPPKRKIAAIRI